MSERNESDRRQRNVTTDRDTIENWARERDAVPVWISNASAGGDRGDRDEGRYEFRREDDIDEDRHERHDWDQFHERFDERNRAFVHGDHPDDGVGEHEFVDRDEAAARATVENDAAEERLLEGETVETEVTETRVVEREVVETETIESEVVDSDLADERTVDREFLGRSVVDRNLDVDSDTERLETATVEVEVEERWRETREEIEHKDVESRVVDTDVEEHEEVESDTVSASVDVESAQLTLLESDVVESNESHDEILEEDRIRSERVDTDEGEVVRSELYERRLIEVEIRERKRLVFELTDTEHLGTETVSREVVETELVDEDYEGAARVDDVDATARSESETGTGTGTAAGTAGTTDTGTSASTDTDTGTGAGVGAERTAADISERDEGRQVVDESGREIGIVTDVDEGTAYVDPDPSLTDRIKTGLGWGDHGEDTFPLRREQIESVEDNRIVISEPAADDIGDESRTDDRR